MKRRLAAGVIALCSAPAGWSAESLLYAVSSGQTGRFPKIERTEVFAVDPRTGDRRLIFSDAGAEFLLLPAYAGSGQDPVMAAAGGRIFARTFDRKRYTGGWPTFPAAIQELSTNGRARRIFDIEGENGGSNFRNLFVHPAGSKVGHLNYLDGGAKLYLIIHEAATGRLLRKTDMSGIVLDCFIRRIGWMPDGERLFFTLETGDVHMTSGASYARTGSYLMKDDSSTPVRIGRDVNSHPRRAGYRADPDTPPVLLGALPGRRLLFYEFQWRLEPVKPPAQAVPFLFTVDEATKARTDLAMNAGGSLPDFRLSPSGRLVAFTEVERKREGAATVETLTVRILEIESGRVTSPFTQSGPLMGPPWITVIGWLPAAP